MPLDISKLENFKEYGSKAEAQCPACFEAGQDKSGNHLFIKPDGSFGCVANPGDKEHRRRIAELAGLPDDSFKTRPLAQNVAPRCAPARPEPTPAMTTPTQREVATYHYQDATGVEIYQVVRLEPGKNGKKKDFVQHRVVNGQVLPTMQGAERVPYHLPEVIKADVVWIVEGEKDADNLTALGIVATCRAGGSATWEPELSAHFAGKDVILCGDNDAPGQKYMDAVEAALRPVAKSIKRGKVPEPHKDITDALEGLGDTEAQDLLKTVLIDPKDADLAARRFDIKRPPTRTEPVLFIGDVGIAKAGDLVVISAQVKAGKSAFLGAMIGCLLGAGRLDCDFLGVKGSNAKGLPVLHFDTEQSPEDYYDLLARSMSRAGLSEQPSWLHSYWATDLNTKKRREYFFYEANRLHKLHGGLCAIFLDGAADITEDVNDATEANALVDELFALAIHCQCPLVIILHENHGTETGKTRGHLGSQLERKAASNLRLTKDENGTIQLWGEKLRRGYIAKGTGPHFTWDDQRQMHVSCETTKTKETKVRDKERVQKLAEVAGDIFSGTTVSLRYVDLMAAIMKREVCSEKTSKRRIEDMKQFGIIKAFNYLYSFNHDFKL